MQAPAFVSAATTNVPRLLSARPFLTARSPQLRSPFVLSARRSTIPSFWTCSADPESEAPVDPPQATQSPADEAPEVNDSVEEQAPAEVQASSEEQAPADVDASVQVEASSDDSAPAAAAPADADSGEKRKRRRTRVKKEVTLPLEDMTVGMALEGTVKSVQDYGAFIGDMGTPTDGLLHVSQLAAGFVDNVTDIVNVGDKLTVRVLGIDMAKGNFSLTMKTAEEIADKSSPKGNRQGSPRQDQNKKWDDFTFDPEVFLDAKVVSVASFGGFCTLLNEEGNPLEAAPTDGLIHISELSNERVSNVSDILSVGQAVKVRITGTDRKRNRISMSLKPYSADTDGSSNLAEDLANAANNQPEFKTSFELAFEKAKARVNQ